MPGLGALTAVALSQAARGQRQSEMVAGPAAIGREVGPQALCCAHLLALLRLFAHAPGPSTLRTPGRSCSGWSERARIWASQTPVPEASARMARTSRGATRRTWEGYDRSRFSPPPLRPAGMALMRWTYTSASRSVRRRHWDASTPPSLLAAVGWTSGPLPRLGGQIDPG